MPRFEGHMNVPREEPSYKKGDKVGSFSSNDNLVARELTTKGPGLNEAITESKKHRQLLDELEDQYGIAVVPFKTVFRDKTGETEPWIVAKKLDGITLREALQQKKPGILEETSGLIKNLRRYVNDKQSSHQEYLGDLCSLGQYMYGRVSQDEEPKIYLVDLDNSYEQSGADQDKSTKGQAEHTDDMNTEARLLFGGRLN